MKDFFSFQSLDGDFPRLGYDLENGVPTAAFGLSDARKYLTCALVRRRVLYVAADALSARRAAAAIAALSAKKVALLAAKDEVLTYRKALSKDALFARLTALCEWERGADVLVADVEALIQLVPKKLAVFSVRVGEERDMRVFVGQLAEAGYSREYTVDGKGAFAVRGDILDIWPVNLEHPVRIDFFGDEVEAIKPYDEATAERFRPLDAVEIAAATDVVFAEGEKERVARALSDAVRKAKNASAYARLQQIAGDLIAGNWTDYVLPLLENSGSLLDMLPPDVVTVIDESKLVRDKAEGLYKEHFARFAELSEGGECMPFCKDQYIPYEKLAFSGRLLALQTFASAVGFFDPLKIYNFQSTPARRYLNSLPDLITDIKAWLKTGYRILIFCGNAERADKVRDALSEEGIADTVCPEQLEGFRGVALLAEELQEGFLIHSAKLAVIGTGDLFTRAAQKRVRRRRGDLFVAPEVGDYAVHETHGVGRITGTKKIETTDGVKEYIALEYQGGDTLYVPVEQMDILSKYMGGDAPALSRIGGGEFERVKARVRASLRKMAFDLKQLYAERQEQTGYVFPEFNEEMEEFEVAFPYEETDWSWSAVSS